MTMNLNTKSIRRFAWVLVCLVAGPAYWTCHAQAPNPLKGIEFDQTDFIRGRLGSVKSTYFVGEPVSVPIYLSNHTRAPLTIQTNFNPRSKLGVTIQPYGKRAKQYAGPFRRGIYPNNDFYVFPMEEIKKTIAMWSDRADESGLAFPEPGRYIVEMEIQFQIKENGLPGRVNLGKFEIDVVAPPDAIAPFIRELIDNQLIGELQLHEMPEGFAGRIEEMIQQMPINPVTPYLTYALGSYKVEQMTQQAEELPEEALRRIQEDALRYLRSAALSDFAYKWDAYLEYIKLLDALHLNDEALEAVEKFVEEMPPQYKGKMAESKLLSKFLVNTQELNPIRSWTLLP